eukprot:gene12858-15100_t
MVASGKLSDVNLRIWVKLFRSENDRWVKQLKYYDIFNNAQFTQECLDYLFTFLTGAIPSSPLDPTKKEDEQPLECPTGDGSRKADRLQQFHVVYTGHFMVLSIIYRLIFTAENVADLFCCRHNLNVLANLYMSYLTTLKNTNCQHETKIVGLVHREIRPEAVEFGDMLYESPLCAVYKGRFNGIDVAIKQLSVEGLGFEWPLFFKETTIICVSQHPRVIKCYGAFTHQTDKPFIVTEFCSRGNLMQALKSYTKENDGALPPTKLIVDMAVEAAQSLNFLHSKGLIHRDVKTANFLVKDDFSVKLIDFGTSRVLQSLKMTVIGTPIYMSTEVIQGQQYQQSADVYSFGIVLWELFTGQTPFAGMNEFERINFVIKGGRPAIPESVPGPVAQLIQQCWDGKPEVRPNFQTILNTLYSLSHPSPTCPQHQIMPMAEINLRLRPCVYNIEL